MISVSFGCISGGVDVDKIKQILLAALKAICAFIIFFVVLIIVGAIIWSKKDTDIPFWYVLLSLCLSFLCGREYYKTKRNEKSTKKKVASVKATVQSKVVLPKLPKLSKHQKLKGEIPRSKKAQENIANMLESSIRSNVNAMYSAATLTEFLCYYDNAINGLSELSKFDKVCYATSAPNEREQLESELQLNLCNAIVRIKKESVSKIRLKYANSPEFQAKAVDDFRNDVNNVILRLSQGTIDVANRAADELQSLVYSLAPNREDDEALNNNGKKVSSVDQELTIIDNMDGHDFEYWCADVLSNCGFQNVIVTRAAAIRALM